MDAASVNRTSFDLFVIGAGSGGVRAARVAASHGASVAIAEEDRFGGTCVIRGCVPKKLLVYASRFADDFADAQGFGWSVPQPSFDWARLIAAKDKEIARLEAIYKSVLDRNGVTVFKERAVVEGANTVRLASGAQIMAGKILIATGGRPFVDAAIAGGDLAITSNEAFHLDSQPETLLISGGGYIAVEFACIFANLGTKVRLLYRGSKILRGFDEDLRDGLTAALSARGIDIMTGAVIKSIGVHGADKRRAVLSDGREVTCDAVMMATGRKPNTERLGLESAGVVLQASGAVAVDSENCSSVPTIFAVGDVTDRVNLTPVAIREGHAFADRVFGKMPWDVNYDMIPTGVFTTPEIATVGVTEAQARARYNLIDIYKSAFRPMRNILAGREERTFMKLIVEAKGGRVVGLHMIGPDAAEIAQMAAIAMNMGASKADFDRTMALHPSAGEELVTMREKWSQPPSG